MLSEGRYLYKFSETIAPGFVGIAKHGTYKLAKCYGNVPVFAKNAADLWTDGFLADQDFLATLKNCEGVLIDCPQVEHG